MNRIEKAKRYDKLNKIFEDTHISEIQARFKEIEPLCKEVMCKECPLTLGTSLCLKKIFEQKWKLEEENEKLKKQIQQVKKIFE